MKSLSTIGSDDWISHLSTKEFRAMPVSKIYTDGSYARATGGSWHEEDSVFKSRQVLRMLERHPEIAAERICDIGCGTGGVLAELARSLDSAVRFTGYEVSPQAHSINGHRRAARCEFILGDPFREERFFDLALVLDVVEHVEDCFAFLRECAAKATWKIYHIPLDASSSTVLRGTHCWDSVGHLHLFTRETALKTVEHSGQRVHDWFLTPVSLERPHRPATRLTNLPRRMLPDWLGARIFGGYSIMILAR
jgi:SAM-dependent methyltransferase